MKIFKGILFWLWSLTWGCVMTTVGLIVALTLLITGHRPYRFHWFIYFKVGGDSWGGFECGPIFIVDQTPTMHVKCHECGHGLQNLILGPLMPLVVSLPSAIRYWFREIKTKKGHVLYIMGTMLGLLALAIPTTVCTFVFNIPWLIGISSAIAVYAFMVTGWQIKEFPKYHGLHSEYPAYDAMLWEGLATRWGEKHFG